MAARVAHNHKVRGSSPLPATISILTSVILAEVFCWLTSSKELMSTSLVRCCLCLVATELVARVNLWQNIGTPYKT